MKRLTLALLLLGACAPAYQAPDIAAVTPAAFPDQGAAQTAATAQDWWTAFGDRRLDALVSAALAQNLDIATAAERVTEAQAGVGAASAGFLPQLSAQGMSGRADPSGSAAVGMDSATLNVGWTLDLFGKAASARRAAVARLEAARAGADLSRLIVAGAVAQTYADLRYAQTGADLTRASLDSRRKTLALMQSALANGTATRLDMLQAEQLVALAEAQLPGWQIAEAQALAHLVTLTGLPRASVLAAVAGSHAQPQPRLAARAGIPAEVIRARPDVIMAERNLAAAAAAVGVARADLWPSLSLAGTITSTALNGGTALKTWTAGPALVLPLFAGGARKAALTAAESRAVQAHLAWQDAVQGAVEDISVALASWSRHGAALAANQHLWEISDETLRLARSTYQIGEGDFLSVLDAERNALQAQGGLAAARHDRALDFIHLAVATAGVPNSR